MRKVLWSALVVALLLTLLVSGSSCSKTVSVTPTPTLTVTPTPAPTITPTPMPIPILTLTLTPMPVVIPTPSLPNLILNYPYNLTSAQIQAAVEKGGPWNPWPSINYIYQTTGQYPSIYPVELVQSYGIDGAVTYLNALGTPNATAIVQSASQILQAQQTVASTLGKNYSTIGPLTASQVDMIVTTIGGTKAQDTLTALGYPNADQIVSACQARIAAISALEPFNITNPLSDFDLGKGLSYATASAIITALGADNAVKYLSALNYPNIAPYIQAVNALMPFDLSNGLSYSTASAIVSALGMNNATTYLTTIIGSQNIGSQSISSYLSQAVNSMSNKP
jgi:hypothetical protein